MKVVAHTALLVQSYAAERITKKFRAAVRASGQAIEEVPSGCFIWKGSASSLQKFMRDYEVKLRE